MLSPHTAWKPSFADGQFGPFSLLHGHEGKLNCKPSAEPQPTFQWYRNGVLISYGENSRYTLQKDDTLVIKKVDKDKDSVNYTCKAQNMMGQDSATTVPTVLGKISRLKSLAKFRRGCRSRKTWGLYPESKSIRLALLLLCFTLYLRAIFQVQAPGGAYIWRGLYIEGLIFEILRHLTWNRTAPLNDGINC